MENKASQVKTGLGSLRKSLFHSLKKEVDKAAGLKNCETQPTILMRLAVDIHDINVLCIHPQYSDYPIFSMNMAKLKVDY